MGVNVRGLWTVVVLIVLAVGVWTAWPISSGFESCGSSFTAAFDSPPPTERGDPTARSLVTSRPLVTSRCQDAARTRLVMGGLVAGGVVAGAGVLTFVASRQPSRPPISAANAN